MAGYYGMPEASLQGLSQPVLFHTGDLLRQDADGYLVFGGPAPRTWARPGAAKNISAGEVEQVIESHPARWGLRERRRCPGRAEPEEDVDGLAWRSRRALLLAEPAGPGRLVHRPHGPLHGAALPALHRPPALDAHRQGGKIPPAAAGRDGGHLGPRNFEGQRMTDAQLQTQDRVSVADVSNRPQRLNAISGDLLVGPCTPHCCRRRPTRPPAPSRRPAPACAFCAGDDLKEFDQQSESPAGDCAGTASASSRSPATPSCSARSW